MRRLSIILLCLTCLAALLVVLPAHAQSEIDLRIDRVDTRAFPSVALLVTITNARGQTVGNIPPNAFTLREKGRSLPADMIGNQQGRDADAAVNIVLVIDKSCYMHPLLDQLKQAADTLLERLKSDDHVALVLMGDQPTIINFTTPAAIRDQIAALNTDQLDPYQALDNGAFEAIRLAASAPSGHRAVIMLTDGRNIPNPDATSLLPGDALQEATILRVPLYAVASGMNDDTQALSLFSSDGPPFAIDDLNALAGNYATLVQRLRQRYWITYRSQLPTDGRRYIADLTVNLPDRGAADTSIPVQVPFIPSPAPITPTVTPPITPTHPISPTVFLMGGIAGAGTSAVLIGGPLLLLLLLALAGVVVAVLFYSSDGRPGFACEFGVVPAACPPAPTAIVARPETRAPTAMAHSALLIVERGQANQQLIQLAYNRPLLIGRSAEADLILYDERVAAQHARIRFAEGFIISDLGSPSGVRVNGYPVTQCQLQPEDRIEIGDVVLVLRLA